jgi:hypothetical protein
MAEPLIAVLATTILWRWCLATTYDPVPFWDLTRWW